MPEEWIIYLVIALLFLTIILVCIVLVLGYKILKPQVLLSSRESNLNRLKELNPKDIEAEIIPAMAYKDEVQKQECIEVDRGHGGNKHYCVHHTNEHAAGVCAICQKSFCESCIKEHEGHSFCEEHFRDYVSHEWSELDTIKTNPDTPESALGLYDFKKVIWDESETPSLLSTHYKINIEGDFIESYVKLVVREEELDLLKVRYEKEREVIVNNIENRGL